jgi:hypothetical protein
MSSINVAMLGLDGLTLLWIVRMALSKQISIRRSPANLPWLALVLAAGISIVAGLAWWNPAVVVKDNFQLVQLAQWSVYVLSACAFLLVANTVRQRWELSLVVWLFLGLGLLFVMTHYVPFVPEAANRLLFNFAMFRVWVVAFAIAMALWNSSLRFALRVTLAALGVSIVVFPVILERGWASGWLPSIFTMAALVALWLWSRARRMSLTILAMEGFAALLALIIIPSEIVAERWSFETRMMAWNGLFGLLSGKWLFGLGLASYWHYWRSVIGSVSYLDPKTGYLHYSFDPQVNMHNNFLDVLGQMGLVGLLALGWLLVALGVEAFRVFKSRQDNFGHAYAAACIGGLVGTVFSGLLGDWFFPFVYNVGLVGFRESFLPWLFLGGLVMLRHTPPPQAAADDQPVGQEGLPA